MAPQPEDIKTVETPVGEEKPESEVMSMQVSPELLRQTETPSAETKAENKVPLEVDLEEDEPSRQDVKTTASNEWTDEDQKHLSERAQKRIRDLNEKAKKAEELESELQMLRDSQRNMFVGPYDNAAKQPLFTPSANLDITSFGDNKPQSDTSRLPWDTTPQETFEEKVLTPEEYQRDVMSAADIMVQARLAQYKKTVEIESDLKRMEQKYSELNVDSPEYSEDLSKKLASLFETQLRVNPNARLAEFVDNIMSLREEKAQTQAKKAQSQFSARTLEQKSEEALTPHEVEPEPEKPFESLSLDEKEQFLKEKGLWD